MMDYFVSCVCFPLYACIRWLREGFIRGDVYCGQGRK